MPINKEKYSAEEYSRLKHEAYLRRKSKLERTRELEEIAQIQSNPNALGENASRSRVFLFYLGLKIGMTLAFTNNKREELSEEQKDKINLWPLDIAQRMVQDGWNVEKIQQRHVRIINETPIYPMRDSKFFRIIESALSEKESYIWEYVYRLLSNCDPESEAHTTAYIIEYETGVPQRKVYSTLQRLQKMNLIKFRDDTTNPHVMNCQPVWLKRGTNWIDDISDNDVGTFEDAQKIAKIERDIIEDEQ